MAAAIRFLDNPVYYFWTGFLIALLLTPLWTSRLKRASLPAPLPAVVIVIGILTMTIWPFCFPCLAIYAVYRGTIAWGDRRSAHREAREAPEDPCADSYSYRQSRDRMNRNR